MNAVRSLTLSAVTSNSFNNVGVIASWVRTVSVAIGVMPVCLSVQKMQAHCAVLLVQRHLAYHVDRHRSHPDFAMIADIQH